MDPREARLSVVEGLSSRNSQKHSELRTRPSPGACVPNFHFKLNWPSVSLVSQSTTIEETKAKVSPQSKSLLIAARERKKRSQIQRANFHYPRTKGKKRKNDTRKNSPKHSLWTDSSYNGNNNISLLSGY